MSSFLSRLGSSSHKDKEKDKTPNSTPQSPPSSRFKLPRSSTRNQLAANASAASPQQQAPPPLPPLDLPSVKLIELDDTTPRQTPQLNSQSTFSLQNDSATASSPFQGDFRIRSSIETSAWVKLSDGSFAASNLGSDGVAEDDETIVSSRPGGRPSTSSSSLRPLSPKAITQSNVFVGISKDDSTKLAKAILRMEDLTTLIRETGSILKERGLLTLGLFRPYRIGESKEKIEKLAWLFWNYVLDPETEATRYDQAVTGRHVPIEGSDGNRPMFGSERLKGKMGKLKRFREELRYAEVHDVVGVLKWGLRHLILFTPFAGPSSAVSASTNPFAWYDRFLATSSTSNHPRNAFSTLLLPSLPPESQHLLVTTLELMQAIVAFTELNAMSSIRLSRQIALYLFGLAPRTKAWSSWTELYAQWKLSGDVLETCLKSFLSEQTDLPMRLEELIRDYVPGSSLTKQTNVATLKKTFIQIEVESKNESWPKVSAIQINDQRTGLPTVVLDHKLGSDGIKRKDPVEILLDTFAANREENGLELAVEVEKVWKVLVEQRSEALVSGERETKILSDETRRVLELVGLSQKYSSSGTTIRSSRPTHGRQRSSTHIGAAPTEALSGSLRIPPSTSFGSFPNASASNLGHSRPLTAPNVDGVNRIVTPSWQDFASTGFKDSVPADEFGLVDLKPSISSNTLTESPKKSKSLSSRLIKTTKSSSNSSSTSRHSMYVGSHPATLRTPAIQASIPRTTLVNLALVEIEDDFADLWLDTLVDPGACSSWPSIIVAELSTEVIEAIERIDPPLATTTTKGKIEHILIAEKLIETSADNQTTTATTIGNNSGLTRSRSALSVAGQSKSPSIADSTASRRWARRASQIFSSNSSPSPNNNSPRKTRQVASSTSTSTAPIPERVSSEAEAAKSNGNGFIARTLSKRRSRSSLRSRSGSDAGGATHLPPTKADQGEIPPPLPQVYSLESLRAASLSQDRPVPKSSTGSIMNIVETSSASNPTMEGLPPPIPQLSTPETTEKEASHPVGVVEEPVKPQEKIEGRSEDEKEPTELATEEDEKEPRQELTPIQDETAPVVVGIASEEAQTDHLIDQLDPPPGLQDPETEDRRLALEEIESPVVPFTPLRKKVKSTSPPTPPTVNVVNDGEEKRDSNSQFLSEAEHVVVAPQVETEPAPVAETVALESVVEPIPETQQNAIESLGVPVAESQPMRERTTSQASTIGPTHSSIEPAPKRHFLGGMSDILRRKTSAEKAQAKLDREVEKIKTQDELRRLKEEEKLRNSNMGKETKIPVPVSSVRARVKELEAERKKETAEANSLGGSPGKRTSIGASSKIATLSPRNSLSTNSPPSSPTKIKASAMPIVPDVGLITADAAAVANGHPLPSTTRIAAPEQEEEHLAVKTPTILNRLPSPLPSPTPTHQTEVAHDLVLAPESKQDDTIANANTLPTPASNLDSTSNPDGAAFSIAPTTPTKSNRIVSNPTSTEDPDSISTPRAIEKMPSSNVVASEPELALKHDPITLSSHPILKEEQEQEEEEKDQVHSNQTPIVHQSPLFNKTSDLSLAETANSFQTATGTGTDSESESYETSTEL